MAKIDHPAGKYGTLAPPSRYCSPHELVAKKGFSIREQHIRIQ
jgi:hypothetical protein